MKKYKITFQGSITVEANNEDEAFSEAYDSFSYNPNKYMGIEEK